MLLMLYDSPPFSFFFLATSGYIERMGSPTFRLSLVARAPIEIAFCANTLGCCTRCLGACQSDWPLFND